MSGKFFYRYYREEHKERRTRCNIFSHKLLSHINNVNDLQAHFGDADAQYSVIREQVYELASRSVV